MDLILKRCVLSEPDDKPLSADTSSKPKKRLWHYSPKVAVLVSPLFRQPFSFWAALKWFIGGWFPLSERLPAAQRNWPDVHFDMRAGIRQVARHADFPEEGIVHPQSAPPT
jgi:hypothetical protein